MKTAIYTITAIGLCAAGLALAATRGGPSAGSDSPASAQRQADAPVTIRGQVRGLYPGAGSKLRLRFANRNPFAVEVTKISVQARASETGCPPESLLIGPPSPATKHLPPRSRRTARVQVTMAPDAPDACLAARLPLEFTASSERLIDRRGRG
ncbi:MAG TPA: hypothetical protein VFY99_09210 [Solirubrobacterales bacterium]